MQVRSEIDCDLSNARRREVLELLLWMSYLLNPGSDLPCRIPLHEGTGNRLPGHLPHHGHADSPG